MKNKISFCFLVNCNVSFNFYVGNFYNKIVINFCNDGLKFDNKICYFG